MAGAGAAFALRGARFFAGVAAVGLATPGMSISATAISAVSTVDLSTCGLSPAAFFVRTFGLASGPALAASFLAPRFFGSTTSMTAGVSGSGSATALAADLRDRFGFGSSGTSTGGILTVVIVGMARSMLRREGAKLSTTSVIDSPIFMNSRALRGAGSDIRLSGT